MDKEEFLQGLQSALSGEVAPELVRENLQYYQEYIRTEMEKGRLEKEIMDELGSPRLIAKTIIDATPGAGEGAYKEYGAGGNGYFGGSYTGSDGDRRDFKYFDSDASRSPGSAVCHVADKGKQRTRAVIKGFCATNTCIAPGI